MNDFESDKGRPLTEEEIAQFRDLLEKDKRVTWIWTTLRVWAGWIAAIVAAYFATKTFILDILSGK